jgi:pantoate--beta-alanine ligase
MARACRQADGPLGLVPTMGALHDGHLALVRRAREENKTVAATIFVNPAQFGPGEDLELYPRDLPRDLDLLREERVDLVFTPGPDDLYPPGFSTWIDVGEIGGKLEGAVRPGHFRGVATVVAKLFSIVRPDRAYFGQKDGQQTMVVRKMVRDLDLGVEVVVLPTVRESDGLAMSSRNVRLNPEQRQAAAVVYRALSAGQALWEQGDADANAIRHAVREALEAEPLLGAIDYVSVAASNTLEELEWAEPGAMLSTAAHLGMVRLIDNLILQ